MPPQPEPGADPDPDMDSLPLDHAHILLSSFNSFLTVAIHNILFYRGIYPPATFLSTRAYNLPVHQNRHPKVCAWIRDAVDAVAVQLSAGHVSRIAVVIHAPTDPSPSHHSLSGQPSSSSSGSPSAPLLESPSQSPSPSSHRIPPGAVLERWLIDTSRFPAWPTIPITTTTASTTTNTDGSPVPAPAATSKAMRDFARILARDARLEDARERHLRPDPSSALRWPDLDEQLRGALRRMAAAAEGMAPLPVAGCTFTVAVELREGGNGGRAPIGHPQAWIPSEPNLQPAGSAGREIPGEDLGGVRTRPIRKVEAGPLFFECWVEEGKAKEEALMKNKESRRIGEGQEPSQASTEPF